MSYARFIESAAPSTPAATKEILYVSNETLPRVRRIDSAGNVWPIAEIFMMSLSSDYTLTDSSSAQKAFNSTTNGQITLPANSGYLLEAEYLINSASNSAAHTWAVLFAGTASITALDFMARGRSSATNVLTADSSISQANGAGSLPTTQLVVTGSLSSADFVNISLRGTLRINAGGTFIPQIKLSAGLTAVEKMQRGSYIRLTPIGSDTATSLGAWT